MKVIIVGGGRLGKQLAMDIPESIIIENDNDKIDHLINLFGRERVLEGTGTSEELLKNSGISETDALVVATNSDHTNYLVAIIAERYKVPKIVVRVDDPDNIDIFKQIGIETVICPAITAARMINSALYPDTKDISEICVFEESPHKGKKIKEMDLPENSMIVAVLRGQHMVRPREEMVLEKGDHVILWSTGGLPKEVEEIVNGGEEKLRPFDSILSVVNDNKEISSVLEESICFATNFDIKLTISSASQEVIDESMEMALARGINTDFKKVNSPGMGELSWVLQNELPDIQCVVLGVKDIERGRRSETKEILGFIRASKIPVLISKKTCPYKRIITLMGYEDQCEWSANLALKVALMTGADLHVMNYRDPEDTEQRRMLYLRRMGRMYDIDVTEEIVEGNPTIEFVSRVTSGEFDLAVINWDANMIKRDVLKRMFFEAPMSVLIFTT
jgi:trk system potassium uptake protein TrkA